MAKQQANRVKNRYKNADQNDDGKVSKEEYYAYMSKRQANFDCNGDGVIPSKNTVRTEKNYQVLIYANQKRSKECFNPDCLY